MSAIKPGDLVIVVRWPHEHCNRVGLLFRVLGLVEFAACPYCWYQLGPAATWMDGCAIPVAWLKKLEPDADLLKEELAEELKERVTVEMAGGRITLGWNARMRELLP